MENIEQVVDFINVQRDRYVDELKQYLAIPSISALPEHQADVRRCAEWTAAHLRQIGLDNARLMDTPGHPIVYADWLGAPGAPTILFYGHYDVQPVDPVALWQSPPFEATVRDGELFARGAADDKGQVFMHFKAVEAYLKQAGRLPVNMKFFLEGEEEVGSAHLDDFVRQHKDLLAGDVVVISDTAMIGKGVPSLCYGLRGLVYYQIDLRGSKSDLHSGVFGGAVANPAFVLCQMIAQLKDRSGRIKIPGFYDDVRELTAAERDEWKKLPFNEKQYPKGARRPEAGRRDGLLRVRARVGTPLAGCERSPCGVYGRRSEDGDSGGRHGEGEHAPRAGSDARSDRRALRAVHQKNRPEDGGADAHPDARRHAVDGRFRQRLSSRGRPGHRERLRQAARLQSRRRLDSGRRDLPAGARSAERALRRRPPGRERPCSERKARSRQLSRGNHLVGVPLSRRSAISNASGGHRPLPMGGRWLAVVALAIALALALPLSALRAAAPAFVEISWFSLTNMYYRIGQLGIVTDGYLTRIPQSAFYGGGGGLASSHSAYVPDTAAISRVLAALGGPSRVNLLLTGHSHFDHSFDTAAWSRLTGARIIGSRTTCLQAQAQGIPAARCLAVYGREVISLADGVTMRIVRWNHSGDPAQNPEQHNPVELTALPVPDAKTGGLHPGVAEDFPNGGGNRGYLFAVDAPRQRLSWFFQNSASAVDLQQPIVVDGTDYGAPLENLKRAMKEAGLDSVDLWIGTGGRAVAELVLPVLKPRYYLPVHWDGLYAPFFAGVPRPYADPALEQLLSAEHVTLLRPQQYMDRWRLDASGVRPVPNGEVKKALGLSGN